MEAARKRLPLVPVRVEGEERKGPPPLVVAEKVEKKTSRSVGYVFFTKTAKAVEATVCIGKMSLGGAKKHMWD